MRLRHSQSDTSGTKKKAPRGNHAFHCRAGSAVSQDSSRKRASGQTSLFPKGESSGRRARALDGACSTPARIAFAIPQKISSLAFSPPAAQSQSITAPRPRVLLLALDLPKFAPETDQAGRDGGTAKHPPQRDSSAHPHQGGGGGWRGSGCGFSFQYPSDRCSSIAALAGMLTTFVVRARAEIRPV